MHAKEEMEEREGKVDEELVPSLGLTPKVSRPKGNLVSFCADGKGWDNGMS